MAYSKDNLSIIGGQALKGYAPQVLTYANKSGDDVTASGYFNSAAQIVSAGDVIKVVAYTTGTPSGAADYVVTSVSGGTVSITAAVPAAGTD